MKTSVPFLLILAAGLFGGCCADCPELPDASVDDDGDGYTEDQGDCDDDDATVHPNASEVCGDGVDRDCSGDPDDGASDVDGDGFVDAACSGGDDCDDADAAVHPDALDDCDGLDDDCDGDIDEDTVVVDASGGGDTTSIQEAVDGSGNGDIICVMPGTYEENVVLDAGGVLLQSLEGSGATIIDGGAAGSVLVFQYGDSSTVQGFTLTNGAGSLFDPDNDGVLDACGGGMFVDASSPTFEDIVITGNVADDGAGVYVNNASIDMSDVVILDNAAVGYGGGLRLRHAEDVQLEQVEVSGNTARTGAGVSLYDSEITLIECDVTDNVAENNGGGFYVGTDSSVELSSGVVSGNSAGSLGGGIRAYSSRVIIAGTSVVFNSAVENGGGVACRLSDLSVTADIQDNDPDNVFCDQCTGCTDSP
jgi:hypothetical protein